MTLGLQTNIAASIALRSLNAASSALSRSLSKLSSGQKATSARDDAAGIAVSSRIRAELVSLQRYVLNAQQSSAQLQIAEGTYQRVNDMLVRMRALSAQAQNASLSAVERNMLNTEYQQIKTEITRMSKATNFNTTGLFDVGDVAFTTTDYTGPDNSTDLVLADFDGDGIKDMLDLTNSAVAFRKGNGDGTFAAAVNKVNGLGGVSQLAEGDFNGDGKMDFAVQSGVGTQIYTNDGAGNFVLSNTLAVTGSTEMLAKDFNNDGKTDLVFASGVVVSTYLSTGGGFGAAVNTTAGLTVSEMSVGDVNNDGFLDVMVTTNGSSVQALVNNAGSGSFSGGTVFFIGGAVNLRKTTIADVNGDGNLDFIASTNANSNIYSCLGTGTGTFATASVLTTMNATNAAVQIVDLNGDGLLDVVAMNLNNGAVSWKQGTGNMTFGAMSTLTQATGLREIIVTDLNNDGRVDLVTRNVNGTSGSRVYLNQTTMGLQGNVRLGGDASTMNNVSYRIGTTRLNGLDKDLELSMITTIGSAKRAEESIKNALNTLIRFRTSVGAIINRLESAQTNFATMIENYEGARSAVADLNVATEMSNYVAQQITVQAGISMVSQANVQSKLLLKLFDAI